VSQYELFFQPVELIVVIQCARSDQLQIAQIVEACDHSHAE